MASVRLATVPDVAHLIVMGRAMHEESPRYRTKRFDADKVRRLAYLLIDGAMGAVFVAETGGDVIGMAAIVATDRWFGPDRYVTDLVIYLKPEHRGNGAFLRLVRAIEEWAAAHGIADLDLGVSTGVDTERTVAAYERMGYTAHATTVLTKRLDDVHRR